MSQSDEQLNQETTEVEETAAGPIEPQELEDTYQQDQLEAYIAERKAAQEQEEAEEAEAPYPFLSIDIYTVYIYTHYVY